MTNSNTPNHVGTLSFARYPLWGGIVLAAILLLRVPLADKGTSALAAALAKATQQADLTPSYSEADPVVQDRLINQTPATPPARKRQSSASDSDSMVLTSRAASATDQDAANATDNALAEVVVPVRRRAVEYGSPADAATTATDAPPHTEHEVPPTRIDAAEATDNPMVRYEGSTDPDGQDARASVVPSTDFSGERLETEKSNVSDTDSPTADLESELANDLADQKQAPVADADASHDAVATHHELTETVDIVAKVTDNSISERLIADDESSLDGTRQAAHGAEAEASESENTFEWSSLSSDVSPPSTTEQDHSRLARTKEIADVEREASQSKPSVADDAAKTHANPLSVPLAVSPSDDDAKESSRKLPIGMTITILNPKKTAYQVSYFLNEHVQRLSPGQSQTQSAKAGSSWSLRFDRGGPFGEVEYSLKPGSYFFTISPKGWQICRKPSTRDSN